ncbi:Uncharacterised protein [Legionella donaldsonii]|uniref:IncA protein n=1 Tax=Legionella donaldsonii TaxID=45060 RepID=A0A378J1T1_9GAMM|nr:phage holin family protein [Legionella donaldsonii]STX41356.1 Uncharacterised protein [Legionella donaldsonii]
MTQTLTEEIDQFNQQALKQELTAALIIHDQLVAMTQDIAANYHSDQTQELQKRILDIAGQSLKGMLHADSADAFTMHQNRLSRLLTTIKEKLALEGDFDQALEDYRFFHYIHRALRNVSLKTGKDFLGDLPRWFKSHPYYNHWQEKLVQLTAQEKAAAFESYKKGLIEELFIKESYQDLANIASLALIEKNSRLLSELRLSYLDGANHRKKLFTDLGWMGLGVLLVAAATVLGLAFPLLVVPGFVVGAAVLGYGVIDFSKESANLYSEIYNRPLGDREISAETLVELRHLENQIDGFEVEPFIANQDLLAEQWSTEKKWMKGAGYAASFAGFALAFAGLAFLIPGVGVPIAAVLIVTVLAAVITAVAALLIGVKIMRERQELQKRREEVDKQTESDDRLLAEVDLGMLKPSESLRNSFTVVFEKEQEANRREVKKLALTPKQRREAFFHENEDESEGIKETENGHNQQIDKGDSSEEGGAKSPGKN